MNYEELQIQHNHLNIIEMDLSEINGLKGLYVDGNIAIDKNRINIEKSCILAEELGHHYTTTGNILDQSKTENRKQEHRARLWAYNKMITLDKLAEAKSAGCRNRYEIAEYLEVTEEFLQEAVDAYKEIYSSGYHQYGDYLICFDPLNIYVITD